MTGPVTLPPPADPTSNGQGDIGSLLARKRGATRTVSILVDPDTGETITFRLRALGRRRFEELRDAHPPTKAQRDEFRARAVAAGFATHQIGELTYDPDVFPAVLLAACCEQPAMSAEQAAELWDSDAFSAGELEELFSAALLVNSTNRVRELGNG